MGKRILALTAVAVAVLAALVYSRLRPRPFRISGYVWTDEIRVGSRVGGRVMKVLVEEGKAVTAGQPLVELEPYDLLDLRRKAEAQLASGRATYAKMAAGYRPEEIAQAKARRDELAAHLERLRKGPRKETIEAARARLAGALANVTYAEASFERYKKLYEQRTDTREQFDRATQGLASAKSTAGALKAELDELLAGTRPEDIRMAEAQLRQAEEDWKLRKSGFRKEDIAAAKAAVEEAGAALKVINAQVAELKVRAPVEGWVDACDLKPGDLIAPNAPALSILPGGPLWVRAYTPENELVLRPGTKVRVTTDSYPGRSYPATVVFVARQAEFTPTNAQTPEKRSEQVFRIKAVLDGEAPELRPGMPVDVWLDKGATP